MSRLLKRVLIDPMEESDEIDKYKIAANLIDLFSNPAFFILENKSMCGNQTILASRTLQRMSQPEDAKFLYLIEDITLELVYSS